MPERELVDLTRSISKDLHYRLLKVKAEVLKTGDTLHRDGIAISEGELQLISPKTRKMLMDSAADYLFDRYDATLPHSAVSIPVESVIKLPDNTRLRLRIDPKSRGMMLIFGTQF